VVCHDHVEPMQWRHLNVFNKGSLPRPAKKLFGNWCAWVKAMREQAGELLEPVARAARMIEGHMEGSFAHWTQGLTTAYMAVLNSLFSAVKRKARGYRTVEYMTNMLYFVSGKLTLPSY
jgi:transposase